MMPSDLINVAKDREHYECKKNSLFANGSHKSSEDAESSSDELPSISPKPLANYTRVFEVAQKNNEPRQEEGKIGKTETKDRSSLFTWSEDHIRRSLRGERLIQSRAPKVVGVTPKPQASKIADQSKAALKGQSHKSNPKKGVPALSYSERCRRFNIIEPPKT